MQQLTSCTFNMMEINLEALCHELAKSQGTGKIFQCNECEYSSKFRSIIDRHKKFIHLKAKKECEVCFKEFSRGSLQHHIQFMHMENNKKYPCQSCGKVQNYYRSHDTSHTNY